MLYHRALTHFFSVLYAHTCRYEICSSFENNTILILWSYGAFQVVLVVMNSCHCRRPKRDEFNPWGRKIPWRRKWQPVFLAGESHGQRSLAGYSPRGHKEPDTPEVTAHRQDLGKQSEV